MSCIFEKILFIIQAIIHVYEFSLQIKKKFIKEKLLGLKRKFLSFSAELQRRHSLVS